MPTCKKCQTPFPNRLKLAGKIHVISKRKYCLDCSPFGKHNTRPLSLDGETISRGKELICDCGRKYVYDYRKGHGKIKCNSCHANQRRFGLKQKAIEYKGGKCSRCGYCKCSGALTFHHLDPSTKSFSIGGNHTLAWERVRQELDKCILVCHNCHSEIHAGII
jgi:hypothetical protein